MTLTERFNNFRQLSEALMSTNSIVMKQRILKNVPKEMDEDLQYIFEILAGQHKFGFTYVKIPTTNPMPTEYEKLTIKEYLAPLNIPNLTNDWSNAAIMEACDKCKWFSYYVETIVNRTLRLGIGKSVLPKDNMGAMLGKSYDGVIKTNDGVFVTEKLDGNRCIARFDGVKWVFTSRNGKPLKVNFDMTGLPVDYIYDGEVMSRTQTEASKKLYTKLASGSVIENVYRNSSFNNTSGLINSKYGDKSNLVYNIFDIMDENTPYKERRAVLDAICKTVDEECNDWRIVPVLAYYNNNYMLDMYAHKLLDDVTAMGAEGLMFNTAHGLYQHKRTNDLLKYKKVKTMDLKVLNIIEGTGKYEGLVGALDCVGEFDDKIVMVSVGTGLSDEQRTLWALDPKLIIGKIVEVAYFSESQNKSTDGTSFYSLRFPRLKSVRNDKQEISQF